MIYAFCNQKGGVGKSTTIYHLARAAVLKNLRVLVIDADPQGNVTRALVEDVQGDDIVLADALSYRTTDTLSDILVPGIWEGLTVAPTAGDKLSPVRDELVSTPNPGRESRLRVQLDAIKADYDLVLIDCAPALDTLTLNALTAAEGVVIITQSKQWSLDGLALLLDNVDNVRAYYNPRLTVAGLIVNLHEANTGAGRHWADELGSAATARGLRLLDPIVPKRQAISDATEYGHGLDQGDSKTRPLADIYAALLTQLMGGKTND